MLASVKLKECPPTASGPADPVNSGGVTSYSLTRVGEVRAKSWGGVVRYDVAFYRGTATTTQGATLAVGGDVWCQAGVGILSFR